MKISLTGKQDSIIFNTPVISDGVNVDKGRKEYAKIRVERRRLNIHTYLNFIFSQVLYI